MSKETTALAERRVKLFKNGRNQAVRIQEAVMRKEGERLIIEPVGKKSLLSLLATWDPIDEEFPPIAKRPPKPVEL
jgi:antitoxin VapB